MSWRKCQEIVESKLENGQCGFRPGRPPRTKSLLWINLLEVWKYGKDLVACFVDFEKAYDRVPQDKVQKVLREYGVDGQLLSAIKSFYCRPEVCVRVNGKAIKAVPCGRWTPARVRFVTSSFHCLRELGRQMQPSWWVCHDWKLQNQSSAIRWWFGSAFFHRISPPARMK